MAQKGTRYLVELFIESVVSPGTWLPERGDVYLMVTLFDQHRQTTPLPPTFPAWFNSPLKFDKIFRVESLPEKLQSSQILIQLMQVTPGYKDGRVLAAGESNAKDFLYPFATHSKQYSTHDRHITLDKVLSFPGITPRVEFSTRVKVEEVEVSRSRNGENVDRQYYDSFPTKFESDTHSPLMSKSSGRRVRRYVVPYSVESSQRTDWNNSQYRDGSLKHDARTGFTQRARSASPNDSRRSFAELYLDDESNQYGGEFSARIGDDKKAYYDRNSFSENSSYGDIQDYTSRRKHKPMRRANSLTRLSNAECDCQLGRVSPELKYGGYGRPTMSSLRKSQSFMPLPSLAQHLDELYITDDGYRVTGIGDRDTHRRFHLKRAGSGYEGTVQGPSKHRMWTNGRVRWNGDKEQKFDFYDYLSDRTRDPDSHNAFNTYTANPVYKANFVKRRPFSAVKVKNPDTDVYNVRNGSYRRGELSSSDYERRAIDHHYDCYKTPGTIEYMDGNDDWAVRNRRYRENLAKQQLSYKW